jgi:hypothetical protein
MANEKLKTKKPEENPFLKILSKLKISGLSFTGGGPEGFRASVNNALKIPRLAGAAPISDDGLTISKGDPEDLITSMIERIGWSEKFYNKYNRPRVKLAD